MNINNQSIVLGLDISTVSTGYSIAQGKKLLTYGCISRNNKKETVSEMLPRFEKELNELIESYNISWASIEAPFSGNNPKTLISLSLVHGIAQLCLQKHGIPFTYYAPMSLKSALLGHISNKTKDGKKKTGNEMKQEVQDKVIQYFGELQEPYNFDITDSMSAIIVAQMLDGEPVNTKKTSRK